MSENIFFSIERVLSEGADHCHENYPLAPGTINVLRGAAIVSTYGWLAEFVNPQPNWGQLEDPNQSQNRPFNWWGWDEFINFYKIRHCFAHSIVGRLQPNLAQDIIDFQKRLANKEIQYKHLRTKQMETCPVYYTVDNDRIILQEEAIKRCYSVVAKYALEDPNNNIMSSADLPLDISD